MKIRSLALVFLITIFLSACTSSTPQPDASTGRLRILASEPFLADITRNIVGDLAQVDSLIPLGIDPHAYEPTPQDVAKIAQSQIFVINGGGLEEAWLEKTIANSSGNSIVLNASSGLDFRQSSPDIVKVGKNNQSNHAEKGDPHFWLDPNLVLKYVENIRIGVSQVDPKNLVSYQTNADRYKAELTKLDAWIKNEVAQIPPSQRLLVTNHESLGYFADRYGFKIIGAVLPSFSSLASPSASQVADLMRAVKDSGAKAIFLEAGSNSDVAQQIASEAGIALVDTLVDHSLSEPDGPFPTYIAMMRYNVSIIVDALR